MSILKKAVSCVDWVNEWIGKILYPLMLLICIVVFIEVLMRSFFNKPIIWSFETTQFLFISCTLLAGGHIYLKNGHIAVDIFYSKFSRRGKVFVSIITFPFFLLYIGSMVYFGFQFSYDSLMKLERTGSVWDPFVFPIKFTIPIGASLLLLQGIVKLIRDISSIRKGRNSFQVKPDDLDSD